MIKQLTCSRGFISFILCLFTWSNVLPVYAAKDSSSEETSGPKGHYEADIKKLDSFFEAFEKLQAQIDRSEFDVKARADSLGPDVGKIFEFVRDRVRYEAYVGVLRGAKGTLIGKAGNSVDQSVLLAELLRHHGHTVKFVTGTLDGETSERLYREMIETPPVVDDQPIAGMQTNDPSEFGLSPTEFQEVSAKQEAERQTFQKNLLKSVETDSNFIRETLEKEGIKLGGDEQAKKTRLLDEIKEHMWVQVKQDRQWVDLDPSFQRAKPGESFTDGRARGSIPKKLHHTVTFEVIAEQKYKSSLRQLTVLNETFNVEALAGASIQFANIPNIEGVGLENLEKATQFMPVLSVNGKLFYKNGFDLQGNRVPAAAFAPGTGKVGAGIAKGFGGIAGAIDRIGTRSAPETETPAQSKNRTLSGEWIKFTVRSPSGEERVYERALLDRIGIENRTGNGEQQILPAYLDEKRVRYALFTTRQMLIGAFNLNPSFVLNALTTQALSKRPVLTQTVKVAYQRDAGNFQKASEVMAKSTRVDLPLQLLLLLQASEHFAKQLIQTRESTSIFYANRANIFLYKTSLDLDAEGRVLFHEGIDIVENALLVNGLSSTAIANAESNILIGLVQANLERVLAKEWHEQIFKRLSQLETTVNALGSGQLLSTVDVFSRARSAGVRSALIMPQNRQTVQRLSLSQEAKTRIKEDLDRGYLVLVPQQNVTLLNKGTVGWWKIDPKTGHLIGMIESGEGGTDFIEYLILKGQMITIWFLMRPWVFCYVASFCFVSRVALVFITPLLYTQIWYGVLREPCRTASKLCVLAR